MANNFGKDSHMRMKSKRFIALFVGLIGAMALGGAVVLAQSTDDAWGTGQANASWSATGTSSFSGSGVTVTCSNDTASGSSTGSAPDAGLLAMNRPTFSGCGDSNSVSTAGSWQVALWSDLGPTGGPPNGCPIVGTAQSGQDENNTNKDCVEISVPSGGATLTVGGICTVTFGPASVWGYLTENSPSGKDTITIPAQTLSTGGTCGVKSGTFSATYTLAAINGSYLDDTSGSDGDPDS